MGEGKEKEMGYEDGDGDGDGGGDEDGDIPFCCRFNEVFVVLLSRTVCTPHPGNCQWGTDAGESRRSR